MAMKRILSEVRDVDASDAARWLAHRDPDYQRHLADWHVSHLLRNMEDGLFSEGKIVLCQLAGVWYLVNGQHQLTALDRWGRAIHVHFVQWRVDTKREYLTLFGMYGEGKARSDADQIRVAMGTGCIQVGAPQHIVKSFHVGKKLAASPRWGLFETSADHSRNLSVQESTTGKLLETLNLLVELQCLVDTDKRTRILNRQPIVAGLIGTHQPWPMPARHFWRQVALGSCPADIVPASNYPPKRLHDWLFTAVISKQGLGRGMVDGRRSVNADEMLCAIIRAWNAWGRGEQLKTIKAFGNPRPIHPIDGAWRTDATQSHDGLSVWGSEPK